jgi:hypothetical protein
VWAARKIIPSTIIAGVLTSTEEAIRAKLLGPLE